ncbi:DUF1778 domain-containing protein [Actinoplanes sp. NPDC051851]|uniref:type II toxin -antitoxin system TacA 1-like antitoxin n=1 Tax=Actinoplanes sp. NPDC051851 TaxID=3154753 RepID=UPI00341A91E4
MKTGLRVSAEQRTPMESAGRAVGASVPESVVGSALDAAADVLADRRAFSLDEAAWRAFDDALGRPAAEREVGERGAHAAEATWNEVTNGVASI